MEEKQISLRVNWHDGMKLNKDHFIASDNYHIAQDNIIRRIAIHENNFGLLPTVDNMSEVFEIEVRREANALKLVKYAFRALMLNGMLIDTNSSLFNSYNVDLGDVSFLFDLGGEPVEKYALIVRFDSLSGIPFGVINSANLPLSRPGIIPKHEFILEPHQNVKKSYFGENFFILAWLKIEKNDVYIDQEYIPPVTSIIANSQLTNFLQELKEQLRHIEIYNLEIAKKYNKLVSGSFNDTILFIVYNMMPAVSALKLSVANELLYEPPIKLITKVMGLANVFYHCLDVRSGVGKDKFLNEVNRVLGVSKKEFEAMLKRTINIKYKHYDIADAIALIKKFMENLFKLLQSLSESDKRRFDRDFTI